MLKQLIKKLFYSVYNPPLSPIFIEILNLLKNKDDWEVDKNSIWKDWVCHKTKDLVWDVKLRCRFRKSTDVDVIVYTPTFYEYQVLKTIADEYYRHFVSAVKTPTNTIEDRPTK
jgi:hypothetical protein